MTKEKILVMDFGGQYTQLIAKRVRASNVFSEIVSAEISAEELKKHNPTGIILSGGPESVYESDAPTIDKDILKLGVPILGICYGMQLLAYLTGGKVINGSEGVKEFGGTDVEIMDHTLFKGIEPKTLNCWMSHGDSVDENNLPDNFKLIAKTKHHTAAIANDTDKIYGVQFHPEVTHSEKGSEIITNFVHEICGAKSDWTMSNFVEECKDYIKETVGKNDVISFVSGGVDSTFVTSILAQTKGIGKVYALYIEALMRKDETAEVEKILKSAGVKDLIVLRAEDRFIKALEGVTEPEAKRKIIGNLFGEMQKEMVEKLNLDPENTYLAQGTLYTDLIESGHGVGKKASNIKSHHNVGCEFIEDLRAKKRLVEPNRLIFKDEVRAASKEIGLPKQVYERQPFPGPGLGIRIVDGNSDWVNDEFYEADRKAKEIAKELGLDAYVLPVKTVGVQGDHRTYEFLCLLRGNRNWETIIKCAKKIPMEVHKVNRILYDINEDMDSVKTDTITKLISTEITKETVGLLQDVDYEVRRIVDSYGVSKKIAQTMATLSSSDIYGTGKRMVALRAVKTEDFMTVTPVVPESLSKEDLKNESNSNVAMTWECLDEIKKTLLENYNVGSFVFDISEKPPATYCWE